MKYAHIVILISTFSLAQSCNANDMPENDSTTVKALISHYFPTEAKVLENSQPIFKLGDFNGDDIEDIAILILPENNQKPTSQLEVSTPWHFPGTTISKKPHKSIAIFNGSHDKWQSDKTRVFLLLDNLGVLETPSFELLMTKKSDADYREHSDMLPIKTTNDFLILPTEAGIDTYVYWDGQTYKLFEPDEIP